MKPSSYPPAHAEPSARLHSRTSHGQATEVEAYGVYKSDVLGVGEFHGPRR